MSAEERYPLLIGHSSAGIHKLHNIQEVADYICGQGQQENLIITQEDGTPFLNTFGIYIDRIADMDYRDELLKVLIPMQRVIDGTDEMEDLIDESPMDFRM